MAHAFIGVGSNINPEANIKKALTLLAVQVSILKISTFYRTEPENHPEQAPYFNGAVEIETNMSPHRLKYDILRMIEKQMGRERREDRYASRTIDLDLLLYDHLKIRTDDLILPYPDILERPYLTIPLLELEPDMILPGSDTPLNSALPRVSPEHMIQLNRYTENLRKEIFYGEQHRED